MSAVETPESLPRGVYAVGGFPRDAIRAAFLSYGPQLSVEELAALIPQYAAEAHDIDLAGEATVEALSAALGAKRVIDVNPRTGTAAIVCGKTTFEYTRFREERYAPDGSHEPLEVVFHSDLRRDALRRDFCCNAIYYEFATGTLLDPLGGIDDLRKGILRAANGAETLRYDGLRVLRLVRFTVACGLTPDAETRALGVAHAALLDAIPRERIYKELCGILTPQTAQAGVRELVAYGIPERLVGAPVAGFPCTESARSHPIPAFFADLAAHDPERVPQIGRALCATNAVIASAVAICRALQGGNLSDLWKEREAIADATRFEPSIGAFFERTERLGLATLPSRMSVGGADCLALGVPAREIGALLIELRDESVRRGIPDEREQMLALLRSLR